MLNIGAAEILVIALLALIVVGPEQLPGLIRKIGKATGQVRTMSDGLKKEFMSSVDTSDFKEAIDPKAWAQGSGTEKDPIVPRGLAEASPDETSDKKENDVAEDGSSEEDSSEKKPALGTTSGSDKKSSSEAAEESSK